MKGWREREGGREMEGYRERGGGHGRFILGLLLSAPSQSGGPFEFLGSDGSGEKILVRVQVITKSKQLIQIHHQV